MTGNAFLELLDLLIDEARDFHVDGPGSIPRNWHMHALGDTPVSVDTIDAVLVGFINHVAARHGIDLALYSVDLDSETPRKRLAPKPAKVGGVNEKPMGLRPEPPPPPPVPIVQFDPARREA
jgi:hypothetical protein